MGVLNFLLNAIQITPVVLIHELKHVSLIGCMFFNRASLIDLEIKCRCRHKF